MKGGSSASGRTSIFDGSHDRNDHFSPESMILHD